VPNAPSAFLVPSPSDYCPDCLKCTAIINPETLERCQEPTKARRPGRCLLHCCKDERCICPPVEGKPYCSYHECKWGPRCLSPRRPQAGGYYCDRHACKAKYYSRRAVEPHRGGVCVQHSCKVLACLDAAFADGVCRRHRCREEGCRRPGEVSVEYQKFACLIHWDGINGIRLGLRE
jgi:hypothetical protein